MKKKSFFVGILALAALALTGCNGEWTPGYMVSFKVDGFHTSKTIIKVEFINGNTPNDDVLYSATQTIPVGGRSSEYRPSGFTVEAGSDTRYCGVKITFNDGSIVFDCDAFSNQSKILVSVGTYHSWGGDVDYMSFSSGNW